MSDNGQHVAPSSLPDIEAEGELATGERLRPIALAGITLLLLGLCAWLAVPFLPALSWAVALAVIAWPLHSWLTARIGQSALAAALTTATIVVVLIVPSLFVSYRLAWEATAAAERVQQDGAADRMVRDAAAQVPFLDRAVAWMDRAGVDVDREMRVLIARLYGDTAALMQGSIAGLVQFAVMLYVLFHIFRDRAGLVGGARALLPTTRAESERLFNGVTDSIYANLYATLITSAIDGIGGAILFWILGLASPVTWGVVMFVLSIIPVLGTWMIWLPAAAYLVASQRWPQAIVLLVWGVGSWVVVDYVIYVRIAGQRLRLKEVPTLIAFLGGLALFGASGMILGPAILAVTVAVLQVWHRRASSPIGLGNNGPAPATVRPPARPAQQTP